MFKFNRIGAKVIAAVSAFAVSAVFMAIAIAPATQNLAHTGMLA